MRYFSILVVASLSSCLLQPQAALAVKPTDPAVRKMMDAGVKFLEAQKQAPYILGGEALVSLALKKAALDDSEISATAKDMINKTLKRCSDEITAASLKGQPNTTYSHSITLMFLCEVGAKTHRPQIQSLVEAIIAWQKPHGAWGYSNEEQGDTSQTQYCLMALWEASKIDIQVDPDVFADACRWLLRVQDPSGGWPYKGIDSGGNNGERVQQHSIYPSVVAAGLGSLYVCADALGFSGVSEPDPAGPVSDTELPPAIKLVRVIAAKGKKSYSIKGIDSVLVARAIGDGNRWFRANASIPQRTSHNPDVIWNFYYLYAMERYKSFREKLESDIVKPELEPAWYNRGYEYLRGGQDSAGAFLDDSAKHKMAGPAVSTAFAVLFLGRNTQKTIGKLTEETLVGNGNLNETSGDITLSTSGRLSSTPISHQIGDLLSLLEEPDVSDEELKKMIRTSIVNFDSTGETRLEQAARLRGLVTHKKAMARLFAVQIMGRTRDLDNVPALIYALDDPHWPVVREARDALRFVSRRIEGFEVPDQEIERSKMREYQIKWTKWYQTIRPDATVDLAGK